MVSPARSALVRALTAIVVVASCSDPMIAEDTPRGCANRYDDDGDGLVDCADPSCIASGVCEAGAAACGDGMDNDRDGRTDCQSDLCRTTGVCDAAETSCTPSPQAGCLSGQGCYASANGSTGTVTLRCRLAGGGIAGDACSVTTIDGLGPRDPHPCAAGNGCSTWGDDLGVCTAYCVTDAECQSGSLCLPSNRAPGRPGLCTVECNPVSTGGCTGAGLACRSFHEVTGDTLNNGGGRFLCVAATLRAGEARPGASCDNPATAASPLGRVCGAGSVCVPNGSGGAVCRASCFVDEGACAGGLRCLELYPGDRPAAFRGRRLGYCG